MTLIHLQVGSEIVPRSGQPVEKESLTPPEEAQPQISQPEHKLHPNLHRKNVMKNLNRYAALLVATFSSVCVTACGQLTTVQHEASADQVPMPDLSAVAVPANLLEPVQEMRLVDRPYESVRSGSDKDRQALRRAIDRGVQQCMKTKGFDFLPASPLNEAARVETASTLVFGDVEYAQSDGEIRHRPNPLHARFMAEAAMSDESLSSAHSKALGGTRLESNIERITIGDRESGCDRTSCMARGKASVVGNLKKYRTLERSVEHLSNRLYELIEESPAWAALQARWSTCMKESGYTVTNFLTGNEMHSDLSTSGAKDQTSSEMRRFAIAYTTCERRVNAGGIYAYLVKEAEANTGPGVKRIIDSYRTQRAHAVVRAKELNGTN